MLSFMLSRSMYLSGCVVHETERLVQPVCSTRQFFIQCHGSGNGARYNLVALSAALTYPLVYEQSV